MDMFPSACFQMTLWFSKTRKYSVRDQPEFFSFEIRKVHNYM